MTLGLWTGGLALFTSAYGMNAAAANCLSADICVQDKSNEIPSTIDFPQAYVDTLGLGYQTFTGTKEFLCADVEVYQLV